MIGSSAPRNSKELKIPPNNINININFTMKDSLPQPINPTSLPKPLAGKKIDNYVHVSSNNRPDLRRANVTTETLKDRRKELVEEQDSSNCYAEGPELLKTRRLDVGTAQVSKAAKKKQKTAKGTITHQEVGQPGFSTNKLKNKNNSREIKEMMSRGGRQVQTLQVNNHPTPARNLSSEKTRRKSPDKQRKNRAMSTQRGRPSTKFSQSAQNLRRIRINQRTPSRSNQKNSSKGSSTKRRYAVNDQKQGRKSAHHVQFALDKNQQDIKTSTKKMRTNSTKRIRASQGQNYKMNEDELAEAKAYIAEKAKRLDKKGQDKTRLERIRQSITKVEGAQTISSGKGTINQDSKKKKPSKNKNTIISTKDYEKQYVQLRQSALKMIDLQGQFQKDERKSSVEKKPKKQPIKSLVQKYKLHENYNELVEHNPLTSQLVTRIQKTIRGFLSRRQTSRHIDLIQSQVRKVVQLIDNKRKQFWGSNSNSILQVEQDIENSESMSHEPIQPNISHDRQEESWSNDYKKDDEESESEESTKSKEVEKMIQKLERDPRDTKNIQLARKLRGLLDTLRTKEQENQKIVKENIELRMNIEKKKQQQSEQQRDEQDEPEDHEEEFKKVPFYIRIPTKKPAVESTKPIEPEQLQPPIKQIIIQKPEPSKQIRNEPQKAEPKHESPKPQLVSKVSNEQKEERMKEIEMLKKFKQQSDNMMKKSIKLNINTGPIQKKEDSINHHYEALVSPKYQDINLVAILKQEESLLSDRHRLSSEEINNMYKNKLISPRSYQRRINQLEKLKEQREEIRRSMEQAEKIMKFVKNIERDRQEVKRLQERSKSRKDPEEIIRPPQLQKSQDFFDEYNKSNTNSNNPDKQSSESDKEPSLIQPLPVPIGKIFDDFQEEESGKRPIIEIFKQTSADQEKSKQMEVADDIDRLNSQVIQFVDDHKESRKESEEEEQEKPGFETNLNFIKQYCIALSQYIRNDLALKQQFKKQIVLPLTYDNKQFLKSYRKTEAQQYTNEYNSFRKDLMYPYFRQEYKTHEAITIECFEKFNDTFLKLKRHEPTALLTNVELETVHLKGILAAFNEALNFERPNGVYGKPMPWIDKPKYLKNVHSNFDEQDDASEEYSKEDQKFDHIFGVAIARIIQWGSSLCGFIPETLELDKGQVLQIDEEYINHIKETRLALMLQKTLAEDEQRLLQFSDEETEVKLEAAQKILDILCQQLAQDLKRIKNKDKSMSDLAESQYFEYIQD